MHTRDVPWSIPNYPTWHIDKDPGRATDPGEVLTRSTHDAPYREFENL